MTSYQDLKSAKYLKQAIRFVEELLGIQFRKTGPNSFSAYCPFHHDRKDSFRVYVNKKGEVRFHCFGECQVDWDVYDVIMARKKYSFRQAQQEFAQYLGIKGFHTYGNHGPGRPSPEDLEEPDEPVGFIEPKELGPDVVKVLNEAAVFYSKLLIDNAEKFKKAHNYLQRRGVNAEIIKGFNIGYAPPFKDEEYAGRALIKKCLDRFKEDFTEFYHFRKAGLMRLLNDGSYYVRFIDFSQDVWGPYGVYSDYFTDRITFPIYDIKGQVHGFMGRRLDNRGTHWVKQKTEDTFISPRGWLYGIDKAAKYISHYKTVILVEGIFDYFAFYNLLQDMNRPVVVSTLGTNLTDETRGILRGLGVENYVVAFDCDRAGQTAIRKIAETVGSIIYYLGGMTQDQDPADKLKDVVNAISGFSLERLMTAAKRIQKETDKPIFVSHLTTGDRHKREVVFKPDIALELKSESVPLPTDTVKEFQYDVEDFLPLLSYDHVNKAALDEKIHKINKLLEARPKKASFNGFFKIPANFITKEGYDDLGAAIILWLRLVIEQQTRKRRIRETDTIIADWLQTSRATISKYKGILKDLGFLNIDTSRKHQLLSVKYFPR